MITGPLTPPPPLTLHAGFCRCIPLDSHNGTHFREPLGMASTPHIAKPNLQAVILLSQRHR